MDISQQLFQAGLKLEMQGDYAGASAKFEESLSAGFVNSEVYRRLGICLSELERYQEAIQALKKSIDIDQTYPIPHYDLGFVYLKLGMRHQSEKEYRLALELAPGDLEFYLPLIDLCRQQKRTSEALALIELALKIDAKDPRLYGQQGQVYRLQDRILDCKISWQKAQKLASSKEGKRTYQDALAQLRRDIAPSTIEQRDTAMLALSKIPQGNIQNEQLKAVIEDLEEVCRIDPFFIQAQFQLAEAYMNIGGTNHAVDIFAKIVGQQPKNQEALFRLSTELIKMGSITEAKDILSRINEINPLSENGKLARKEMTLIDVRNRYGPLPAQKFEEAIDQYHNQNKDWSKAADLMTEAVALAPDVGLFHYELGWIYLQRVPGYQDMAVHHFRQAVALDSQEGRFYGGLGMALVMKQLFHEAVPVLMKAISLDPNDPESRSALAACYIASNELDRAENEYRRMIELDPYRPDGWANLDNLLMQQQKFGQARNELERLVEIVPDAEFSTDAKQRLSSLVDLQDYLITDQKNIPIIPEEAAARLSDTLAHLCSVGRNLEIAGFHELAVERYKEAIAEDFDTFDPHFLLGNAYHRVRQYQNAIREFTFAISMSATDREIADAYFNMGNCFRSLDNLDRAISAYQKSIEVYPAILDARGRLAECTATQGKYDQTIEMIQEEMNIQQNAGGKSRGQLNFFLGEILLRTGRTMDALFEYKKGLTAESTSSFAHESVGLIISSKGLWNLAQVEFEKALEIQPFSGLARPAIQANRFIEYEVPWFSEVTDARVKHSFNYKTNKIKESQRPIAERLDFINQVDSENKSTKPSLS